MAPTERIAAVSPDHEQLTVKRQCERAEVSRSTVYRKWSEPVDTAEHGESDENLELMRLIDQAHLE